MRQEPKRLSHRIQQQLQEQANELWLSPVSTWEVLLLHAKRKVKLEVEAYAWVAEAIQGFREAPLTHDIIVVSQQLLLSHADPADRFLAATAKVLDLTLVTADLKLLGLREIITLANR